MKQCDTCFQFLPLEFFYPDPQGIDGRVQRCSECTLFNKKKRSKDEIDRRLIHHNAKTITMALTKLPFKSTGYNVILKKDVSWILKLKSMNWFFECGGTTYEIPSTVSTKQKINYLSKAVSHLGIRLELSPFDREMAKRTIYIY